MSRKESGGKGGGGKTPEKPPRKRVFDGQFPKYWHFVKYLTEEQRSIFAATLSQEEQQELMLDYKKGGWNYLFMRNACDQVLDRIKNKFGVDWLTVKAKALRGKPQLVQKSFWQYLNQCFEDIDWKHIAYIFDGLIARDFDADYVKVCLFEAPPFIDEEDSNDTKGE